MLIQAGADPDPDDIEGTTPLVIAAQKGHCEVLDVLLRAGASFYVRGEPIIAYAASNGQLEALKVFFDFLDPADIPEEVLTLAIHEGNLEMTKFLLDEQEKIDFDINATE